MPQSSSRKALIVEDNAPFRQRLEEALDGVAGDWTVAHATNAGEALALLWAGDATWDLVLVDLGLPDTSGIDVIRQACLHAPDAPVLVISVLTSSAAVLAAIRAGARGYLQKDDSAVSLSQAITDLLAGDFPLTPALARHLFQVIQHVPESPAAPETALSTREFEFLGLLGRGFTYDEAARRMGVSLHTVQTFSKRIYMKLDVASKGEALTAARERGWIR